MVEQGGKLEEGHGSRRRVLGRRAARIVTRGGDDLGGSFHRSWLGCALVVAVRSILEHFLFIVAVGISRTWSQRPRHTLRYSHIRLRSLGQKDDDAARDVGWEGAASLRDRGHSRSAEGGGQPAGQRTCRARFTNAAARAASLSSLSALYRQLRNMAGFEACRSSGLMMRA